ncbi:cobaltochelatase CobT [Modicisalibacter ilicicola DSM 19980]|uniref:Cobaltochelatase CobT n=1 Tax=Modicisalibacter ilicicola DSM 19980 TaxID=1121942 RepID=A0A1M4TGZ2_9GAMM|nr:cobalt chelatase [Halomonas ilicicola]SHE43743.1 cobaltochelatase CobT [Halomonas ilicicola DSM 19980]
MASPQQLARRQQHIEELCAASLRALTGERDLHYRGRRLHRGTQPVPVHAPHLRLDDDNLDFTAYRGVADATALRLLHSDIDLHRRLCPEAPVARLIFELLEQLRVEALVPKGLPGMADNLDQRFEAWSQDFHNSRLTEGVVGRLVYATAMICWTRITGRPLSEETGDFIETIRGRLVPIIGADLAGLRRHRENQAAFAEHALRIAQITAEGVAEAREALGDDDEQNEDEESEGFALLLDFDEEGDEGFATALSGHSKVFADSEQRYRVYTDAFDREDAARDLVRDAKLEEYRQRLDKRLAELGINLRRLAQLFTAHLSNVERDGWSFGEEEGHIDGRRLAQLITSPAERRLFRLEQHKPRANSMVSFLIDCSGSMKTYSEPLALVLDLLARALEMAGVATEILGFTTTAWNGGRAQQEWTSKGRPAHPGRLNEVRYLVFKEAAQRWRRVRRNIGALLKHDLYREGIDGEAVDWACNRMLGRDEQRRILIVVSDGCPMDTATHLANDKFYLDNHLKDVVARRERQGDVEIRGLGVGLDLSPFYRHSLALDLAHPLDNEMLMEVAQLIVGRVRQR